MKNRLRTPIIISSLVIVTGLCAAAWGAFHPAHGASPPPGPDEVVRFTQAMTHAMQLRMDGKRLMSAGDYQAALERYKEAAPYDPFTDRKTGAMYRIWLTMQLGRGPDKADLDVAAADDRSPPNLTEALLRENAEFLLENENLRDPTEESREATSP